MKKARVEQKNIQIRGQEIPVKIYREFRTSIRASIGRKAAVLRLPALLSKKQQEEKIQWFYNWVEKQLEKNRGLQERFQAKSYEDGSLLKVGKRQYRLRIEFSDRKTHGAKLKDGIIHFHLSSNDPEPHLQKSIQHLLSRVVAQDFFPEIERRVLEINNRHFRQPVKSVRLKYNHSNWGSCSSSGNINLSTRLLFAPDEVIDYVIVHELAHLVEFNHTQQFWELVGRIMPDYREKEKWLKENKGGCTF